jgi:hypothetical protein
MFAEPRTVPHSIISAYVRRTMDSSTQHHPLSCPVKLASINPELRSGVEIPYLWLRPLILRIPLHLSVAPHKSQLSASDRTSRLPLHMLCTVLHADCPNIFTRQPMVNTTLARAKWSRVIRQGHQVSGKILPSTSECSLMLPARFQRLTLSMLCVQSFWNVTPYRLPNCCYCSRLDPDGESATIRKHLQRTRPNVQIEPGPSISHSHSTWH